MDTIVIKSAQDVAALARDVRTGRRQRAQELELKLDGLAEPEAAEISALLNKHYFACGCAEATTLGLAGLFGSIFWLAAGTESLSALGWQEPAIVIGAFFVGTGVGKGLGRLRARLVLQALVAKLATRVAGVNDIGKGDGSVVCSVS